MSYADECMARGRVIWASIVDGIKERQGRRWFLVPPAIIVCFVVSGIVSITDTIVAAPELCDDGYSNGITFFLALYSAVVIAGITAPKYKTWAATLTAISGVLISYPWHPRGPDFDADWPNVDWGGGVIGCILGLLLVFLRLRPRWLLLIPAYFTGFFVMSVLSLIVLQLVLLFSFNLSPVGPGTGILVIRMAASFGAIIFAFWMAPVHKWAVAVCVCIVTSLCGFYSGVIWNEDWGGQTMGLYEYFLGSAAALAFALWRTYWKSARIFVRGFP